MPQRDRPVRKGRFTGARVKVLRPQTYRRAVELLAEPREQVPYDHICRLLRMSEHTLKAIEKAESLPIAERKQALLAKAMRIAHKAADRIEDQIDSANIGQASVTFGVATDKINLLNSDATIHLQHSIQHPHGYANWLYDRLDELYKRLIPAEVSRGGSSSRRFDRSISFSEPSRDFGFGR